jgi:RimJ/RimL family protein N-acetyltransferase
MIAMRAVQKERREEIVMRTPRLALSPLAPRFATALFDLLSDWEVVRMLAEVPWPLRFEGVAGFLESEHPDTDDFVLVGESGPIGVVAVKHPGSGKPPRQMPRLGYWIGKKFWRQGYGTEAIGALVDHAFATHASDRVGAGVFHDNAASRGLLEKLGFETVGSNAIACRSRGETIATVDMQITRVEWARAKAARA